MFKIIDENKKLVLSDNNYTRLRTTALLLVKETENGFVPMFNEENIDELITEYSDINNNNS